MASNPWNSLPKDLLENPEFQNNVKSLLAMVRLRDALVAPTERIMKEFVAAKITPGETCTECTADNIKGAKGSRCPICQPRMKVIMGQAGTHGGAKAQINWSNSDPRKWNTHYWEVAKCYLGPGQKDSSGPETTDCANIITLWLNCCKFTPFCAQRELLENVRVIRNKLMHSPDMKQSAEEMAAVFESIKGLLNEKELRTNPDVDCRSVIADLKSIRDKISVTFSELKGDLLVNLMKQSLRAELAETYLAHYSQLQPVPWAGIQFPINTVYQKQSLQKYKDARSSLRLRSIFEPSAEGAARPQRLLIEGAPGMGKTTLCQRLVEYWALVASGRQSTHTESASKHQAASPDELNGSRLDEYQLVFFLRVRELGAADLVDNLLLNLVDACWQDKERLNRCICDNIKQVLLVLDGYDEGDDKQKKLAEGWLMGHNHRGCTVILSSRPDFYQNRPEDTPYTPPDMTYTLQGLNKYQQKSFAEEFDKRYKLSGEKSSLGQLTQLKCYDLLQTPLLLALFCVLAKQGQGVLSTNVTEMYNQFVQFFCKNAKLDPNFTDEFVSKLLNLLQKVAFDLFNLKKSEMTSVTLCQHVSKAEINKTTEDFCKVGLVIQEIKLKGLTTKNQTGTFIHQTFLEYFAAHHFVSLSNEERSALLENIPIEENMLVFVAGLCGESEERLECFRQMMKAWKRAVEREEKEKVWNHSVRHACLPWVSELQNSTWLGADHVTEINQMPGSIRLDSLCAPPCSLGVTALVHCAAQHHDSLSSHKPLNLELYNCCNMHQNVQLNLLNLALSSNVNLTCEQLNLPNCLTHDQCERLGAILPRLTHLRVLVIVVSSLASVNYVVSPGFNSTSKLHRLIIYYWHDSSSSAPEPWLPPDELLDNLSRLTKLSWIKLVDTKAALTTENKRKITSRLNVRLPCVLLTIFDKDAQTGEYTAWKDSV